MTSDSTFFICATTRLAQYLKAQKARSQVSAGQNVSVTLNAVTIGQWLDWCVQEAALRGLCAGHVCELKLLDAYQERVLWEQVITRSLGAHADTLFDVSSLARSAMEAHHLSVMWDVETESGGQPEECLRFAQWRQVFYRECEAGGWVDAAYWQKSVIASIGEWAPHLNLPPQVVFAGFTRFNPQEDRLRQLLRDLKLLGDDWAPRVQDGPSSFLSEPESFSYPDVKAEAMAVALWAQERLQRQPQGWFALLVPDLASSRHLLQDTLEDVLMPEAVYPGQSETPRPFNISLGVSLAQFPLVDTALQLLHLATSAQRVEQGAFSALLRNAHWSDVAGERSARALFETELRKSVSPAASLKRFLHDIQRQIEEAQGRGILHLSAPRLVAHLHATLLLAGQSRARHNPSDWARRLPAMLQDLGWLHQRKLSSHEYQTRKAFIECVGTLGRLDDLLGEVTLMEISTHLRRMCMERTFQPQTEGRPRLQVLGLLEASGLNFDGMWVMGMQDSAWPPPARPNPLLPAEAQRKAGVPNASASIQLDFAQKLQEILLTAAPELVFSWSRMAGASELNPSSLIPPTPQANHLPAPVSPHWTFEAARQGPVLLEPPIEDHMAPAVSDAERVRGGTWLLRAQAICPAWAYFQYRLGAVRLEEPVEGLDARKRGTFLHDSLEFFWKQVQTSDALRSMAPQAQSAKVVEAVLHVLTAHDEDPRNEPLKPRLRALEQERLHRLIGGWLHAELQRNHDFTVIACEREVNVDIQGIRFRMFVDRIDQLEDGSLLVIDYKTGANIDTRNWATERLTEPQLPIYASIQPPSEGAVNGVVFAKVLMKDPTWVGLARQDKLLTKVTGLESKAGRKLFPEAQFPDWNSVLQHWKRCVHGVAQEIKAGEAGVRFDRAEDLRWCDVKPLLRMDERQAQLQAQQAIASGPREAAA